MELELENSPLYRIKFSNQAEQDLLQIYNYISEDSVYRAKAFTDELLQAVEKWLCIFPEKYTEYKNWVRTFPYKNYLIVFRVSDGCIDVLTITSCYQYSQYKKYYAR